MRAPRFLSCALFAPEPHRPPRRAPPKPRAFYLGDVISAGRWSFDLGLRFDAQRGRNLPSRAPANGMAPDILPNLEYGGGPFRRWRDLSPRAAISLRIGERTTARASYARFASQLGFGVVTFDNPAQSGFIQYRFRDDNGDHLAQSSELLQPTGRVSAVLACRDGRIEGEQDGGSAAV
jgi:hypothetical protein